MTEGRYRDEPMDLVDQIKDLQRRLSSLEQNPQGAGSSPGSILAFGGPVANIPSGFLLCNGAAVSRTTYGRLFTAIGTTWGVGDGSTTFNLPDLINQFLVGAGGLYTLGSAIGATTHDHASTAASAGDHGHAATGDHGHAATGDHSHTNPSTDNAGSHSHGGATGSPNSINKSAPAGANEPDEFHSHSISADGTHGHTQGGTGTTGSHAHANTGSHAHANTGSHMHTMTNPTASSLPPSKAVTPIIRY